MNNLLAIESSSTVCSVALGCSVMLDAKMAYDDILVKIEDGKRTHTQFMLPFVDELLQSKKQLVSDLTAIAFSAGPGSFTGIRLATSVAKSLAYAANIPIIPISSLAAIAQAFYRVRKSAVQCLVITDARMGEVYCAEYGFDQNGIIYNIKPDRMIKVDELQGFSHNSQFVVGDAWSLLEDIKWLHQLEQINLQADARDVLVLAQQKLLTGDVEIALNSQAVYLRDKTSWKTTTEQNKAIK